MAMLLRLPRPSARPLLSPIRCLLAVLRPFVATALIAPQTQQPVNFAVDYLVSSCGLSPADAVKASCRLAHLKSPQKPEAVLNLLKETGLDPDQIRRLVLTDSRILVADAKKTLRPKIMALQEVGFSKPLLAQLISVNSNAIRLRSAACKIVFWRKLVGNDEAVLRIAKNIHFLGCKLGGKDNPNVSLLRRVGVSDNDIAKIVVRWPGLMSSRLSRMTSVVERATDLGVAPGSGMFAELFLTLCNLSKNTLEAKSKLLRSFGWSEEEVLYVFRRFPAIFRRSEEKIRKSMDFLMKEAGCEPAYIARRASFLSCSFDKRLMPRFYVLRFLKEKGLPGAGRDLYTAVMLPDKRFLEKYIAPIAGRIPELLETYPQVRAMAIAM